MLLSGRQLQNQPDVTGLDLLITPPGLSVAAS